MQLTTIAELLVTSIIIGDSSTSFTGVQTDHRKVRPGDLFICLQGHAFDGHHFAAQAVEQGAVALVVQQEVDAAAPKLVVKDTRYAMAVIACHFYGYPSHEMKLIGVTGTNGKTTTTHLIDQILTDRGHRTGLMGTIRMKIGEEFLEVKNTTQDALDLQANFRKMVQLNTSYCIMEVSSHALEMGRVKGCRFRTAVFTNLTQDHLDYHKTMENYRAAKGLLFSRLGNSYDADGHAHKFAVLNADDPAAEYYGRLTSAQVITYGIHNAADIKASDVKITSNGTEFNVSTYAGEANFRLKMLGHFNVYNALGAIATTLLEGVTLAQIKNSLEGVSGVEGRVELVNGGQEFLVLVDYAHTPDGLENVLSTVREFARNKVLCVFGCGGDRDKTKRPVMGKIAAHYSDYLFVTSDNPRSEDPESILKDIEQGITEAGYDCGQYELIVSRREAIQKAVEMAGPDDVVLIAGKGHEPYQIIKGVTYDFDDRAVAKEAIRGILK